MNTNLPMANGQLTVVGRVTPCAPAAHPVIRHASPVTRSAFSLVEILVVVSLLSLIVLALMAVFSSTQRAFRAAVTQTDVLEGSRATMELMTADLRTMTPSGGVSNGPVTVNGWVTSYVPVNFFALDNNYSPALYYFPLLQTLPGSGTLRTNVLNYFFLLGRDNINGRDSWTGIGYAVNCTNNAPLYPLYRYYASVSLSVPPLTLFTNFTAIINNGQWTNASLSHVMDGVVHLTVRAYDPNGYWQTNGYMLNQKLPANVWYSAPANGEVGFCFFSNTVPASVELELGVLEDRILARAESLSQNPTAQSNYLAQQSGAVHVFRQRVNIPNVDPTAYQ